MSVEILEEDVSGFEDLGRLRTSMKEREANYSYNPGMEDLGRLGRRRRELGDMEDFGRLRTSMKEREANYAFPQGMEDLGRLRLKQKQSEAGYTIEGLAEEIMTLEELSFGGSLGLEDTLSTPQQQAQLRQEKTLHDLLDQRRAVISTSAARVEELQKAVEEQDRVLGIVAKKLDRAIDANNLTEAKKLAAEGNAIDKKRTRAAIQLVRYAKLRGLATLMARNVKTQIELGGAARRAKASGDIQSYRVLAQAFSDVGKSTAKLTAIRAAQKAKWEAQNKAVAEGKASPAAVSAAKAPDAAAKDVPGVFAVADLRDKRRQIESKLAKLRAEGKDSKALVEARYNLARQAREAHAQGAFGPSSAFGGIEDISAWYAGKYSQDDSINGLESIEGVWGKIKGGAKAVGKGVKAVGKGAVKYTGKAAKTVGKYTKKATVAVGKGVYKATKFGACKIAGSPQVQQAAASNPHPYAQGAAMVSGILKGACGGGGGEEAGGEEGGGGEAGGGGTGGSFFAKYKLPILIGGGAAVLGITALALKGRGGVQQPIMMMAPSAPKAIAGLGAVGRRRVKRARRRRTR